MEQTSLHYLSEKLDIYAARTVQQLHLQVKQCHTALFCTFHRKNVLTIVHHTINGKLNDSSIEHESSSLFVRR
jgi:hypothetical protein